jgi:hypothetical protein
MIVASRAGYLIFLLSLFLAACESQPRRGTLDPVALQSANSPISQAFDYIEGIVSLDDSQSVLVDRDANAVYEINWGTDAITSTGHQGSGPGEYQSLDGPVPGGPGRILILDRRQRRVVAFDSTRWFNAGDLRSLPLGVALRGGDRNGNLYFEYRPISHEGGGTSYVDSSLILRLMPDGTVDTIAHLLAPKQVIHVTRSKNASGDVMSNSMAFDAPYTPRDAWVVNPDGGVTILRSDPVRLDLVTEDSVLHGAAIELPRIAVTESDRSDSLVPVPAEELPPWPEWMPPFEGQPRRCGPDQQDLIVRRAQHVGGSVQTWLILQRESRSAAAFTLDAAERLVGCDRQWIYVARPDSSGTEQLGRYGLP